VPRIILEKRVFKIFFQLLLVHSFYPFLLLKYNKAKSMAIVMNKKLEYLAMMI